MTDDGVHWSDRAIDRAAKLAGTVGLNEVRVRWKLLNARRRLGEWKRSSEVAAAQVAYRHRSCPRCRALQAAEARRCTECDARLGWRGWDRLRRLGIVLPVSPTVTGVLVAAIVAAYARSLVQAHAEGSLSLGGFTGETLLRLGAHVPALVAEGEWWRLLTAVLLHGGILHLLFNLFALSQVGPAVEELFGAPFAVTAFVVTGMLGSVGSALFGLHGMSVGASGAVMGLCGVAAGWGQREGTSMGREIRNRMLQWALYTLLFGLLPMVRVDNGAHAAGFLSGGLLGMTVPARWMKDASPPALRSLLAVAAGLALAGALALVLFPPRTELVQRILGG